MIKFFYNGRIYDENFKLKKNIVISNEKILYIGDEDLNIPFKVEKIDLKGKYVFPSFFDSHLHLSLFSKSLLFCLAFDRIVLNQCLSLLKGFLFLLQFCRLEHLSVLRARL